MRVSGLHNVIRCPEMDGRQNAETYYWVTSTANPSADFKCTFGILGIMNGIQGTTRAFYKAEIRKAST